MYAGRDDQLTAFFSEDFSGFTGGGDFLVKDKAEWVAITRQDFAQVTKPIRLEVKDLTIQSLAETIAVATTFFRIHLPIKDHFLSRRMARLVLIFRKESAGWKISHSSISLPEPSVRDGEVYPLAELADRNQALEHRVVEQTALLADGNERLRRTNEALSREIVGHRQAEIALVAAERLAATGTLVRGMAHEINNPLASVVSNLFYTRERLEAAAAAAAAKTPVDAAAVLADVAQAMADATEGAVRIRDIVADLRCIALGDLSAGPASSTLADGVTDAQRVAAQELARCSSVQVDVPHVSDLTIAHRDLVQLVAHLLTNAGQATGAEPNHVRVETAGRDPGHVELRVTDTGAGMTEATMARAFEPFFTTKDLGKGRGLGLAVCLGIVEAVGGELHLASKPGAGTTVTVVLPRGRAQRERV